MIDYRGRVCVVTGAGSGIGRALAVALGHRGAHVVLSDIDLDGAEATRSLVEAAGGRAYAHRLDVSNRVDVLRHAEDVKSRYGGAFLVVNNAGVGLHATVAESTWEDLDWLMGVNFWGVVHGTKAFLEQLESTNGHLVTIASVFSLVGVPRASAYNAAKFGVRGFTEALRSELRGAGSPVSVHCVLPGGVDTGIARNSRLADESLREQNVRDFASVARTSPAAAASAILRGVDRGRGRIMVGRDATALHWASRLLPTDRLADHIRRVGFR